jgi:methionyl-tRNA synthetase
VNKDLADVLGNFLNRLTRFTASRFEGKVPEGGSYGEDETALIADLDRRVAQYSYSERESSVRLGCSLKATEKALHQARRQVRRFLRA